MRSVYQISYAIMAEMKFTLNKSQKEGLSDFFNSLAVGWFTAIFLTPTLAPQKSNLLILSLYGASMVVALVISLSLRKE